jgi:hypothetical protein
MINELKILTRMLIMGLYKYGKVVSNFVFHLTGEQLLALTVLIYAGVTFKKAYDNKPFLTYMITTIILFSVFVLWN